MTLARPVMGLRLPARSFATSCARANSNSSVPTPSPSDVPNPRRRDPRLAPRLKDLKPEDVHTPIVYRTRIPRSAAFRTRFKDAPEHQHINFPHPMFATPPEGKRPSAVGEASDPTYTIGAVMGMQPGEVRKLSNFNIITKRVVNMTKKGKQPSIFSMAVVGSPEKGLVGIGRGRGVDAAVANRKATTKAALSMDYVNRFENRTVWGQGDDLKAKFGATTVFIRARPPGFGLQVPHILHRVFSACGIRDASATIEGSRNPMNVVQAAIQILHGGFGPPGYGSGKGTPGRKQDKGAGMRSIRDIERQRGRFGVRLGREVSV